MKWLWNKVQITLCERRCSVCGFKAIATPHYVKCCDAFGECAQWTLRMNSCEVSLFIWSLTFHAWQTFHPTIALQFNFQINSMDKQWNTLATTQHTVFVFFFSFFLQFCVSVHHIMISKNTSLMQLISIYFTYSKSLLFVFLYLKKSFACLASINFNFVFPCII